MYVTIDEFEKSLSPTLRKVLSAETNYEQDNSVIQEIIMQSSSLIDSYVGYRYRIPLDHITEQVKAICCDITTYRLFKRKNAVTDEIIESYKLAIQFLHDVSSDKALINGATKKGCDTDSPDGKRQHIYALSSSDKSKFDEENLKGWCII